MLKYLERYLGKWIGWRACGYWFGYGMLMTFGAALGVGIFYTLCVILLLWN
jgi:hypothetical protein